MPQTEQKLLEDINQAWERFLYWHGRSRMMADYWWRIYSYGLNNFQKIYGDLEEDKNGQWVKSVPKAIEKDKLIDKLKLTTGDEGKLPGPLVPNDRFFDPRIDKLDTTPFPVPDKIQLPGYFFPPSPVKWVDQRSLITPTLPLPPLTVIEPTEGIEPTPFGKSPYQIPTPAPVERPTVQTQGYACYSCGGRVVWGPGGPGCYPTGYDQATCQSLMHGGAPGLPGVVAQTPGMTAFPMSGTARPLDRRTLLARG